MGRIDEDHRRPTGRRFRVRYRLGSGGFGEVYRASMIGAGGIETEVALKRLRRTAAHDPQAIQHLRREGRILATLDHPAILRVHDLVTLSGELTLVTEYIKGADLGRCLSSMPLSAALEAIAQVADGLAAAWSTSTAPDGPPLGLLHRDIKPSNIRISQHGQAKILDFGIATLSSSRPSANAPDTPLGSAPYMAPERFEGRAETPASDVFSLGCLLFEAVAGERLFQAQATTDIYLTALSAERHHQHTRDRVAGLDAPPPLAALLDEMLAYDSGNRPGMHHLYERLLGVAPPGPSLRAWARERSWSEDEATAGEWAGRVVSAGTAPMAQESAPHTTRAPRWSALAIAAVFCVALGARQFWPTTEAPAAPLEPVPTRPLPAPAPPPVAPVPPAQAEAEPAPPPRPTGIVRFSGDHSAVFLVDAHGSRYPPGRVPAGSYEIVATFPTAGEQRAGRLEVASGGEHALECVSRFYSCK